MISFVILCWRLSAAIASTFSAVAYRICGDCLNIRGCRLSNQQRLPQQPPQLMAAQSPIPQNWQLIFRLSRGHCARHMLLATLPFAACSIHTCCCCAFAAVGDHVAHSRLIGNAAPIIAIFLSSVQAVRQPTGMLSSPASVASPLEWSTKLSHFAHQEHTTNYNTNAGGAGSNQRAFARVAYRSC